MEPIYTETAKDSRTHARAGVITLPHGTVQTPMFMPVGTNGTVKALLHDRLEAMGYSLLLGNTYHLYLRPGQEVLQQYGSLHRFSSWKANLLTDSGGFQVFSLADFRKITPEGIRFRSHIDGSSHWLTPESVVDFQTMLQSDIQMALDVCTAPDISEKKALEALIRTQEWARRAQKRYEAAREAGYRGHLFAIVQGNFYKDLRKRAALELAELDFPGYAIGGLSVGESPELFNDFLAYTAAFLPEAKPRYVMGIGTPDYVFACVENGIDLFDCVFPTRIARNGSVLTPDGIVALKKEDYAKDSRPIEEGCPCSACRRYSRGFLRHLIRTHEITAAVLCSEHNLWFMKRLMDSIRKSIIENRFLEWKAEFLSRFYGKAQ